MAFRSSMRKWLQAGCSVSLAKASGKSAVAAASLFGAVGLATSFASSDCSVNDSNDKTGVSVMTWNVLARPYTKYNSKFHCAHEAGTTMPVEEPAQTRSRYAAAGHIIVNTSHDLVLLQECEADFFEPQWNSEAAKVLKKYHLFACRQQREPGTAVLVRKDGRATSQVDRPLCIGGTDETGGVSKVATIVPVRVGSTDVSVVSSHFGFDGMADKRLHHMQMLGGSLTNQTVVLGGDFNCAPGPNLDTLASSSFIGDLQRAVLRPDEMTGLSGDFSKAVCIDHVYVSPSATVIKAACLAKPISPWDGKDTQPAPVVAPSDHVPVVVAIAFD